MSTTWLPIFGSPLQQATDGSLVFEGGVQQNQNGQDTANLGLYVSNHDFSGGTVAATVEFAEVSPFTCFDLILSYDPQSSATINAGIPAHSYHLFAIREYRNTKWNLIAGVGDHEAALKPRSPYKLVATVAGSAVRLEVDGILVLNTVLPSPLPKSQVGLLCLNKANMTIRDFRVETHRPTAFVVMQFSSPFNDLYSEVIKSICSELNVDVFRSDDEHRPGMIVSDISRAITESSFIIADVTPVNANVFYELGYAHGRNKPAIILAERATKLPFDVSPFRTLFYDNSIAGKPRLEAGLRSAIQSILRGPSQA